MRQERDTGLWRQAGRQAGRVQGLRNHRQVDLFLGSTVSIFLTMSFASSLTSFQCDFGNEYSPLVIISNCSEGERSVTGLGFSNLSKSSPLDKGAWRIDDSALHHLCAVPRYCTGLTPHLDRDALTSKGRTSAEHDVQNHAHAPHIALHAVPMAHQYLVKYGKHHVSCQLLIPLNAGRQL